MPHHPGWAELLTPLHGRSVSSRRQSSPAAITPAAPSWAAPGAPAGGTRARYSALLSWAAPSIAAGDIASLYVCCARSVRMIITAAGDIDAGHRGRAEQLGADRHRRGINLPSFADHHAGARVDAPSTSCSTPGRYPPSGNILPAAIAPAA